MSHIVRSVLLFAIGFIVIKKLYVSPKQPLLSGVTTIFETKGSAPGSGAINDGISPIEPEPRPISVLSFVHV